MFVYLICIAIELRFYHLIHFHHLELLIWICYHVHRIGFSIPCAILVIETDGGAAEPELCSAEIAPKYNFSFSVTLTNVTFSLESKILEIRGVGWRGLTLISSNKQVSSTPNIRLLTRLMNFVLQIYISNFFKKLKFLEI